MIQRINLSLILESCENPTFVKDFAHTVSLLSFFLDDSSNISFWMIPPIFPFFTRTFCNYIWSGPARQSLRGKEAEARNATRQPAPCLMSFTGSTKIFFWYRECRTCFFSSQVSGELCWQCLARVDIVSLVNLSYQNKVTDRRNIEKMWRITKAKLFVSS